MRIKRRSSLSTAARTALALVLLLALALSACGGQSTELTPQELNAFNVILDAKLTAEELTDVTADFMTKERQEKFEAVKKVYRTPEGDYAFVSKPVAYNGPVDLAVCVDGETHETIDMRIVEHVETDHYVRNMEEDWFTDRFAGKTVAEYLNVVHLEAERDNEVIIITGATVTTQGIVNGVNAIMGVYREAVLGETAEAVPYMVEGFEGPEPEEVLQETGSLVIRAEGRILGEVSLEEIRELPSVQRQMVIQSSVGDTEHSFRGTLLSGVLDLVDPALKEQYQWVQTIGVDDYISDLAMEEVRKENAVYLMYEDQDQPLLRKDGLDGAMRVVVLDDTFGQRFTNYMIEIVLL